MAAFFKSILAVWITLTPVWGQPAFEVASVRPTPPGSLGNTSISPVGARFTASNVTLEVLLEFAFGVNENQLSGQPGWAVTEHYDVSAKAEGDKPLTREQLQPLLRQLLETRFKLATHRSIKDVSGYALVVAKGGPKLQKPTQGSDKRYILPDGVHCDNVSIAFLAAMLARPTGRPVVDQTGIEGNYDIELKYAPEGTTDSSLPSLYTAVQEQLGLKLEPRKVPLELLVIDHAEKVPTEN